MMSLSLLFLNFKLLNYVNNKLLHLLSNEL